MLDSLFFVSRQGKPKKIQASRAHSDSPHTIRGQGKSIKTPPKSLPTDLPSTSRKIHAGQWQATAPTLQAVQ